MSAGVGTPTLHASTEVRTSPDSQLPSAAMVIDEDTADILDGVVKISGGVSSRASSKALLYHQTLSLEFSFP